MSDPLLDIPTFADWVGWIEYNPGELRRARYLIAQELAKASVAANRDRIQAKGGQMSTPDLDLHALSEREFEKAFDTPTMGFNAGHPEQSWSGHEVATGFVDVNGVSDGSIVVNMQKRIRQSTFCHLQRELLSKGWELSQWEEDALVPDRSTANVVTMLRLHPMA